MPMGQGIGKPNLLLLHAVAYIRCIVLQNSCLSIRHDMKIIFLIKYGVALFQCDERALVVLIGATQSQECDSGREKVLTELLFFNN